MVGVPGRSKGCNTCIQRKIKCDGGQPVCANCTKSKRACGGYRRPVAFVLSSNVPFPVAGDDGVDEADDGTIVTQGRWRRRARKADARARAGTVEATSSRDLSQEASRGRSVTASATDAIDGADTQEVVRTGPGGVDVEDVGRGLHRATATTTMTMMTTTATMSSTWTSADAWALSRPSGSIHAQGPWTTATTSSPLIRHVPTEAAWRVQLFAQFVDFHHPEGSVSRRAPTQRALRARSWLLHLPGTSLDRAPALEAAMTALGMSRVGRRRRDRRLVDHSLRVYTRGLRDLQRALRHQDMQLTDQTLAACVAMSLYEVAECPARRLDDYHAHHSGALALLRLRGPDAHASPLGHALLVFLRAQQFIYALMLRKPCFLAAADWLRRPWKDAAKDPLDAFLDDMYAIPALLEQSDLVAADVAAPAADRRRRYAVVVDAYNALAATLHRRFVDLEARSAADGVAVLFWPEPSRFDDGVDAGYGGSSSDSSDGSTGSAGSRRPFSIALHFPDYAVGQSLVMYWLISAVIDFQKKKVYQSMLNLAVNADADADIAAAMAATDDTCRDMSLNLCQSVEYFLQPAMGDIGAMSMMLPLTVLRHILVRTQPLYPCRPGPPDCPGFFADEVIWVDALLARIAQKGQLLAYQLQNDGED